MQARPRPTGWRLPKTTDVIGWIVLVAAWSSTALHSSELEVAMRTVAHGLLCHIGESGGRPTRRPMLQHSKTISAGRAQQNRRECSLCLLPVLQALPTQNCTFSTGYGSSCKGEAPSADAPCAHESFSGTHPVISVLAAFSPQNPLTRPEWF